MVITKDLKAYIIIMEKIVTWRNIFGLRSQQKNNAIISSSKKQVEDEWDAETLFAIKEE
jgi:hypothetical protein